MKGNKETSQELVSGIKNSLLAGMSGIVQNKSEGKETFKKSQSPIRKEYIKSCNKNVNKI